MTRHLRRRGRAWAAVYAGLVDGDAGETASSDADRDDAAPPA